MALSEYPFWKRWGLVGVSEWQVDRIILSRIILRRSKLIDEPSFPWKTIGTHLLNSIIAGIGFSVLQSIFYSYLPIMMFSVLYNTIVYSFILWVLFPVLGRSTFESLGKITIYNRGLLVSLLSHFVYGISFGFLLLILFLRLGVPMV
jgi:hypothetical protein